MALAAQPTRALAANPAAPYTQCPAVGADTSCTILIVIQPDGSLTILSDGTQKAFDGSDDTLVGVLNNSAISVPSIAIGSSTQPVFGFEKPGPDGLCAFAFVGSGYCKATPKPATGYEGPTSNFSAISANKRDGTVNFTGTGGLRAGTSTFFSLETAIAASKLGTGAATSLVFTSTSATTVDHADSVMVAASLRSGATAVPNAAVTFTLAPGPTSVSCVGMTNALGVASCALSPTQRAGVYQLTASYGGSSVPFLAPVNITAPFTVTLEQDVLTYTGPTAATAGQPLVLSGVLATDDPSAATPLSARSVALTLGNGPGALGCSAMTDTSGAASCTVMVPRSQLSGNRAVTASFLSDGVYQSATAAAGVVITNTARIETPDVGAGHDTPWIAALLLTATGARLATATRRRW